jgi:hypothetical protein
MRSIPHVIAFSSAVALFWLGATACGGGRSREPGQPIHVTAPREEEPASTEESEPDEPASGATDGLVVSEDACETDADCVPAACCHAAACVGRTNAPPCGDAMCTQECRYGTLDCGGACLCHEGRCAARLSEPPAGLERIE